MRLGFTVPPEFHPQTSWAGPADRVPPNCHRQLSTDFENRLWHKDRELVTICGCVDLYQLGCLALGEVAGVAGDPPGDFPGRSAGAAGGRRCLARRAADRLIPGWDPVTSNYVRVTGLADLLAEAGELSVRTMIFDVEPLVAPWHGSQGSLDQGIARILGDVRTVPSVRVVIFATNSARRPSAVPACDGIQVRYLASAGEAAADRAVPRPSPGRAPWQVISSPPMGYSPIG